jgi:hypothetical protein
MIKTALVHTSEQVVLSVTGADPLRDQPICYQNNGTEN